MKSTRHKAKALFINLILSTSPMESIALSHRNIISNASMFLPLHYRISAMSGFGADEVYPLDAFRQPAACPQAL